MSVEPMSPRARTAGPEIRSITDTRDIAEGIRLYRTVFHTPDTECTMAPRLLAAMARHGGFVLGAHRDRSLIGFAYGFAGITTHGLGAHLYLQLIAVHPRYQNSGIGRSLMNAVAEHARAAGISRIRWAFDPRDTRNAHFYLDVVGARGKWFVPDMYGTPNSHRVIAEWDAAPVTRARPHTTTPTDDSVELREDLGTEHQPDEPFYTRLANLLSTGYELVSCSVGDQESRWRLCHTREHN
ncbi:GNAT family N-acetyltransferase [Nocardia sp. NPDC056064]|uniref:GNAT family N-acetyltransferase n=1 Tax=Nocardia sp. NPDC056064 TaxID=3345701 RepID=UPI0035DB0556